MNAERITQLGKKISVALGAVLLLSSFATVGVKVRAKGTLYYDDFYTGQGTRTSATYSVYCDEMVVDAYTVHPSAPSYGCASGDMPNSCGPSTGSNVVVFYDRYYPNLIADFEPGMLTTDGYRYYGDSGWDQTEALMENLYDLMQVGTLGGTTSANFKSALNYYSTSKGYTFSYYSFYSSATTVNIGQLITAINAGKVGVIMCSEYNFVYSIDEIADEGRVQVSKVNSTTGHMMMVYGYETISYYDDGVKVRTDTFLNVSSGYSTTEKGYMQLNEFSVIDEAIIVAIS